MSTVQRQPCLKAKVSEAAHQWLHLSGGDFLRFLHAVADSDFDVVLELFDIFQVNVFRVDLYFFDLEFTVDSDLNSRIIVLATSNYDNFLLF